MIDPTAADKEMMPYDVVIVGAGLSGIGSAYWLQQKCPDKRYIILEARQTMGGTWDLFRYPGIRSDSDMFTFGYAFKPWKDPKSIAEGESIREYLVETARENNIDKKVRFGHKVIGAVWSSEKAYWTLEVSLAEGEEKREIRTRFLYMCSGYYNYQEAYRPTFAGEEDYKGKIVIPQFWPEELDYTGKKVIVVGSGATAVTLVPTMAGTAAEVSMLQRSPSYILPLPDKDSLYLGLKKWLPNRMAYKLTRWKNLLLSMLIYQLSRQFPQRAKQLMMKMATQRLGPDYEVEKHFNPNYNPWDQRLCLIPNGDLYEAIHSGKATVITDHIDRFTPRGIRLRSGRELEGDIIVLATGLKIKLLGGATIKVDGKTIPTNELVAYKGMMMSGLPNFAVAFGYANVSWTLKTDLTANYICKLLRYMDRHDHAVVVPCRDDNLELEPFLNLTSGYFKRAGEIMPKQGARSPWRVYQNYFRDMLIIRYGRIADGVLQFGAKGQLPCS